MKHRLARGVLTMLLVAVAVFDITAGMLVLTGVRAPTVQYQGTLFADATVPMLLLTIVVGGGSLLAGAVVFGRHAWGLILAAAAGITMIAWELVELAVVQRFSSISVYIGLAAIALSEYLWATEFSGRHLPPIKHEVIRSTLVVIAAVIATSAIAGGSALLRGEFDRYLSDAWLSGTPFGDYTIPGLLLVFVVGGGALFAAATAFVHHEWAVLTSALAGLLMAGYLVVEAVILDSKVGNALPTVLALQLFFFVLGLALLGLAGFLWRLEYRGRHRQLGHAGHG